MKRSAVIRLLACAVLLSPPVAGPLLAEEAADMFECADCHPMKIRDFKSRRTSPIVPLDEYPEERTGKQDIASTSGMCLSCHDGFVEDSREVWTEGYRGHRVGMVPSHGASSPELEGSPEFPVNEDGKVYCGTCHSAHLDEDAGASAKAKPFMRASSDGGDLCQACHQDKRTIADSVHDKGSRRARDYERRGICGTCHVAHGSDQPLMWVRGHGEGNHIVNRFCRSCHDESPQPAEHPDDVVAWSQALRESVRGHSPAEMPVYDESGHASGVGSITCATCHDLHQERATGRGDELPGLHLRMPELVEPLCADCHGLESMFLYKFFHSTASR